MAIIQLASDTLAVTPSAGQMEYNGTIQTFTPLGTQRGIVPAEQFFRLNANVVGANVTTAQSIFGVGVTLSASTIYEFEINCTLSKSAGTTSHIFSILFGGTATVNNILYTGINAGSTLAMPVAFNGGNTPTMAAINTTAAAQVLTTNSAIMVPMFSLIGTVSINAGGTFIPQYILSAAPGGAYSTLAGSFIKIRPIGVSGANVSVGTWA